MTEDSDFLQRRALVTGAAVLGAGLAATAPAAAQTRPGVWVAAKEALDDWLEMPGAHRYAFDCVNVAGAAAALGYIRTYYLHSKDAYNLDPQSLVTVVILRSAATPVAFTDVIWAKYGTYLSANAGLVDPVTKAPALRNIYNTKGIAAPGASGVTLADLARNGVKFAVCGTATGGVAEYLAKVTGGQVAAIRAELVANLISNARVVPAGIITLNRVQERGYAVSHNAAVSQV